MFHPQTEPSLLNRLTSYFHSAFKSGASSSTPPPLTLHSAASTLNIRQLDHLLSIGHPPRPKSAHTEEPIHAAIRAYNTHPPSSTHIVHILTLSGALSTSPTNSRPPEPFPPRLVLLLGYDGLLSTMLSAAHSGGYLHQLQASMTEEGIPKLCCELGSISGMLAILNHGWNGISQDKYGNSLLHYACNAAHLPESKIRALVQVILDYGKPNLTARDSFGRTALQIASRRRLETVCQLLRRYGADEESYTTLLLRGVVEETPSKRQEMDMLSTGIVLERPKGVRTELEAALKCVRCAEVIEPCEAVQAECGHVYHAQCLEMGVGQT